MTRWKSPNCPPDGPHEVLAKTCGGYYKVVVFDFDQKLWKESGTTYGYIPILGWREIYE